MLDAFPDHAMYFLLTYIAPSAEQSQYFPHLPLKNQDFS